MSTQGSFKQEWLRPFFFYGNNRTSLIGGAVTTASALVLIGYWVVSAFGRSGSSNPYIGIIFDLLLPGLFVFGLVLIALGIVVRQAHLKATGKVPAFFPEISMQDPVFRHGVDFVLVATFINFVIVGTASYRGVAYMDTPEFCGAACHVMAPEFANYHVSSHRGVACTECHIAPGAMGFVHAKVNGTKQLAMVLTSTFPRPIMADNKVPAAAVTCLKCHNQGSLIGDKLLVTTSFGDDEANARTSNLTLVHVGGKDAFGHLSGIHGAHMGHIEYIATDSTGQTIPWVAKTNADGSVTEFAAADAKLPAGAQKRTMDCLDCHNRAAHSFSTPENALNKLMAQGSPNASLPFIHKEGLELLKASYDSPEAAQQKIASGLAGFYRSKYPAVFSSQRAQIDDAAKTLTGIYTTNVFPAMKVTWGTHPNNIGHNDSPGCFRCHDGSHTSKAGATITNDCSLCHNLLVSGEANPKLLTDLGMK